ncbi:MAG: PepSY domain-containing protein [Nitrospiraceae bacterium]
MAMKYLLPLVLLASLALLSTPAWSDKGKKGKRVSVAELAKDAKITIDQAIKTGSEKVPGTVVQAELEKKHGKTVWEVEVLDADGKVTEVHIDAATGEVIDTEEKHAKRGKKKH